MPAAEAFLPNAPGRLTAPEIQLPLELATTRPPISAAALGFTCVA